MNVVNGPSFNYGTDYTVIHGGTTISWTGLLLQQQLQVGDVVRIAYSEEQATAAGDAVSILGVLDNNSRVDSNNIVGTNVFPPLTDIAIGVFFNTPIKIRYNNFYRTDAWYQGGTPTDSTGNFSDDPLFNDEANNDFRLKAGSPDIDAGDPERWDKIFEEMGIVHSGNEWVTGGTVIVRENIAPFDRDIDITGIHRYVDDFSGDVGSYEYANGWIFTGVPGGDHVAEYGYDFNNPGTVSFPYETLDRAFDQGFSDEIFVRVNPVPGQTGSSYIPFTGKSRRGRYNSKNLQLNPDSLSIGDNTEDDIAFVYPLYPSFATGEVYVAEDGDDASVGSYAAPLGR